MLKKVQSWKQDFDILKGKTGKYASLPQFRRSKFESLVLFGGDIKLLSLRPLRVNWRVCCYINEIYILLVCTWSNVLHSNWEIRRKWQPQSAHEWTHLGHPANKCILTGQTKTGPSLFFSEGVWVLFTPLTNFLQTGVGDKPTTAQRDRPMTLFFWSETRCLTLGRTNKVTSPP